MKKSFKRIAIGVLSLFLLFLLAVFHYRSGQKPSHSNSSPKVTQIKEKKESKKKTSSSITEESSAKTGETTNSTNQTSTSEESSTITKNEIDNNQESPITSSLNINEIANGNFSTVSGTWQNANGDVLIFNNNGLVSDTKEIKFLNVEKGIVNFGFNEINSLTGGSILSIIPAGTVSAGGNTFKQDVLVVGQSVSAESLPYYKVS